MTAEEIRTSLARSQDLPEGRAKVQLLESLAEQARQVTAPGLEAEVLIALSHAYEYASEREKLPITFGRLLQLLDEFPAEVGHHSHSIYWMLKWMTDGLHDNPLVPLAVANRWLDEFDNRYRQRGFGSRPVLARRSRLARHLGDDAAASELMEASIAAPRDEMADCVACEHSDWGTWREVVGDDKGALEYWAQLLGGSMHCLEEPHRALAKALLPLLRTGRVAEARGVFLRGYPMVARNVSLMPYVGNHVEFCALTGNEARGLEILAEHADWLPQGQVDADTRLSFLIGAVR